MKLKRDVLFLDFLLIDAHKLYCNALVNKMIEQTESCVAITKSGYLDFKEDAKHIKFIYAVEKIPGANLVDSRIKLLKNMKRSLNFLKNYAFKKVIILGYENLTFLLYKDKLNALGEIYLVQHHQLDELMSSSLKRYLFGKYKNKVMHILLDESIVESVANDFDIDKNRCYVFTAPPIEANEGISKSGGKNIILSISNSNDENMIDKIVEYENRYHVLEGLGYEMVIRTTKKREGSKTFRFINKRLTEKEYDELYADAKAVLLPFPVNYRNRCSGSLVDAASTRKVVICSSCIMSEYYQKKCPSICKVYTDIESLFETIQSLSDINQTDYDNFMETHSADYSGNCAKLIWEGRNDNHKNTV